MAIVSDQGKIVGRNASEIVASKIIKAQLWLKDNYPVLLPLALDTRTEGSESGPFAGHVPTAMVTYFNHKFSMYMNYAWVSKLPDPEFNFVYVHELLHLAFNHLQRMEGKNWDKYVCVGGLKRLKDLTKLDEANGLLSLTNIAQDEIINGILVNIKAEVPLKIPSFGPSGEPFKPFYDPKYAGKAAEEVYRIKEKEPWRVEAETLDVEIGSNNIAYYDQGFQSGLEAVVTARINKTKVEEVDVPDDPGMTDADKNLWKRGYKRGSAWGKGAPDEYLDWFTKNNQGNSGKPLDIKDLSGVSSAPPSTGGAKKQKTKVLVIYEQNGDRHYVYPPPASLNGNPNQSPSRPKDEKDEQIKKEIDKLIKEKLEQGKVYQKINGSKGRSYDPNEDPFLTKLQEMYTPPNLIEDILAKITVPSTFKERIPNPKIDVRHYLHTKKIGGRGIVRPAKIRPRDTICDATFAIDSSGSMSDKELEYAMSLIIDYISKKRLKNVMILVHSSVVVQKYIVTEKTDIGKLSYDLTNVAGRGGTDFQCVYDEIENVYNGKCKVLIHITDQFCPFPEEPPYPVHWLTNKSLEGQIPIPPYGKTHFYDEESFKLEDKNGNITPYGRYRKEHDPGLDLDI